MARLHAEERRKQLLAAAREEFLRVGPEGARVGDIAKRAGVNVALLYRYFESKEQLFEEAIVEPLDHLLQGLLFEPTEDGEHPETTEMIEIFYRTLLQMFTEYLELFNVVLFSDRANGHEFYLRRIAPFMDSVAAQTNGAGPLWQQSFDATVTTPMCVGMCWGVAMDAHFRGTELDVEQVVTALTALTIGGLANVPPPS